MKFALVFLIGCFAIAAQGSSIGFFHNELNLPIEYQIDFYAKDGLVEKLRELLEAASKKAKEIIDDIKNKVDGIAERIAKVVEEIIGQSEGVIKRFLEKVLERIEEIGKQSAIAKKCVEQIRPAVDAAVQESNKKMEVCAKKAAEDSEDIIKDMQVHVDAVHANIDSLKAIVNGCTANSRHPVEVAKCITSEAKQIHDNVMEIIANARKGLDEASERAVVIVDETKVCAEKIIKELEEKLNVEVENIEKCINDNSKFYLH